MTLRIGGWRVLLAGAAASMTMLAGVSPVLAQQPPRPEPDQAASPNQADERTSPPASDTDAVLDLAAEDAEAGGIARVIVGLDVRWNAHGYDNASPQGREQQGRVATRRAGLERDLEGTGYQMSHDYDDRLPFVAMEVSSEAIERLRTSDAVATVEIDEVATPTLEDSDQLMGGDIVHAKGHEGASHAVSILDTGVQAAHPFFGGRVVAEACFSSNGSCPGGGTEEIGPGSGEPCTYDADGCPHGTHVAGIAAGHDAVRSGVAPGAGIVSVQVFSRVCSGGPGGRTCRPGSYSSDQLAGMQYSLDLKLREVDPIPVVAVNMSLGSGQYTQSCDGSFTSMKTMVDTLLANGIATMIAAGNDGFTGSVSSPGCISSAVTVGATTKGDTVGGYSNSDDQIDLLAPGSAITSAVPGGGFDSFSGTSMATPQVAGAFALVAGALPGSTIGSLLTDMQSSGFPVTDTKNGLTKPRLSLLRLLDGVVTTCPPDDGFEDNDTLATATRVLPGTALSGLICPGDDDFFVLTGLAGATLTADLLLDSASGDLELAVLDATGATLSSSATTTDTESVSHTFTSGSETVHLRVSGATGTEANDYVLRTGAGVCPPNEATEPNGDYGTAVSLIMPTAATGASCNGADNASLDHDFYAVTLEVGGQLHVTVSGADPLRLYLDDPDGTEILGADSDGTETSFDYTATEPGTHYILVFPYYYSQQTLYRIEVEGGSAVPPSTGDLFEPYTTLPAGDHAEVVATGDLTGDGITDVVTVEGAGTNPQMYVFPGTGGGLGPPVTYYAGPADTVDIGDLNGDGFADVVVGTGTELQVFPQDPATHALQPPVTLSSPLTHKIRIGDVTGDGVNDVVGIGWDDGQVAVWVTTAPGTLLGLDATYPVSAGGDNDLELGDVNDDLRLDVVVMSGQDHTTPNLSILTQSSTGTLNAAVTYNLPGGDIEPNGIGVGDVTRDGKDDVVVSQGGNRPTSKISVFPQNASGTLDAPTTYDSLDSPGPVEVADINDDGLADVVTLHSGWSRAGVNLQQLDGTLAGEDLYEIPYVSDYDRHGLAVGDINGDLANDLAIGGHNKGLLTLAGTADVPPPLQRFEESSAAFSFGAGWFNWTNSTQSGGMAKGTRTPSATASVTFTGATVEVIGQRGPNRAIAAITLDGIDQGTIDTYAPTWKNQSLLFTAGGLDAGAHTLTITWDSYNPSAGTTTPYLMIDAINAYDTPPLQRFEESSAAFSFGAGWFNWTNSTQSGGMAKGTRTPSATASVTFTGATVEVIGQRGPNRAIAAITLDGIDQGTIDTYAPTWKNQSLLFTAGGLDAGAHTLTITWDSYNPSAGTTTPYLMIDAINAYDTPT